MSVCSFPFFKGKQPVLFSSVFACTLEFIYRFHFLNFLKYLQERKLRHEILWLEADFFYLSFLGRLLHSKDKSGSHKNVLFLEDSSLEALERLSKIHNREKWGGCVINRSLLVERWIMKAVNHWNNFAGTFMVAGLFSWLSCLQGSCTTWVVLL